MWWDADLDPLPASGNTSMVFGNCGNSIAPLAGAQRDEIVDLLCFLEDLPLEAFQRLVPWTWERWPDYVAALEGRPTSVHAGGYVGHLSLRTYVMGPAAWERAATPDEVQRMCAVLDEGLAVGALGLSLNFFDRDRTLRLVPGFFADDDELLALFRVVARHRPATVQCITRFNDREHDVADAERMARLLKAAGGAGPVARHPHERARRRPPARPLGRPPPHPGRRRRPVAGGRVQAPRPVLQLRALDRVPAGAGVERVGQRPGRDQARHPGRPGLARPGPHRLGQPHPLVALPHRPPARDDPHRVRDRRRSRRHLAGRVRRAARACTSPTPWPSGCSPTASAR